MDKPFSIGDKVKCIKKGDWHIAAGLGYKSTLKTPVYGQVYTVSYIDRPISEKGESNNGIDWAMTLEEFPENETTNEPKNVFSCRRFVLA